MQREFPIMIYGATGFTGELICKELERRKIPYAISGRNSKKLEDLQKTLPSKPPIFSVDYNDSKNLRNLTSKSNVILSCAGPFIDCGLPIQDSAIDTGTHFMDIGGEALYLMQSYEKNHERAKKAGISIINAVGFDVVATDIPAWLASQGLNGINLLEIGIAAGSWASQGTMKSGVRSMKDDVSFGYENNKFVQIPPFRYKREIPFPHPEGMSWAISLPWADIVTAPRSTKARNVRVYMKATSKFAAWFLPKTANIAKYMMRSTMLQSILANRVEKSPLGPSESYRANARCAVWVQATAENGEKKVATLQGPEGYTFTSISSVESALQVLSPSFSKSGVLTPSEAFNVPDFVKTLEKHNIYISS